MFVSCDETTPHPTDIAVSWNETNDSWDAVGSFLISRQSLKEKRRKSGD